MFAGGKMPMRTFADGRFTGILFAAREVCRSKFPCETEMSEGYNRAC